MFTEFAVEKSQTLFGKLTTLPFNLPWSHYLILMRIQNEDERSFYEVEAVKSQWNVMKVIMGEPTQHQLTIDRRTALLDRQTTSNNPNQR